MLGPTLVPGDVVVLDNLPVHKVASMAALVEARLLFCRPIRLVLCPSSKPCLTLWLGLLAKMHKISLTIAATMYIFYETALNTL